jgi:hypothetical protein
MDLRGHQLVILAGTKEEPISQKVNWEKTPKIRRRGTLQRGSDSLARRVGQDASTSGKISAPADMRHHESVSGEANTN